MKLRIGKRRLSEDDEKTIRYRIFTKKHKPADVMKDYKIGSHMLHRVCGGPTKIGAGAESVYS